MKKIIIGVLIALCMSVGASVASAQETLQTTQSATTTDCPFNNPTHYVIDCYTVQMPMNHDAPESDETVQLAVAVIHSTNPNPQPDPVLYLEGGPGGLSVPIAPIMPTRVPFLAVALDDRDVILVDQRGMGASMPQIFCTPFQTPMDAFATNLTELFETRMADCPQQFAEQGLDWHNFTTEQNALDLSKVGAALGYEQVNLFGVSYGTELGLIILRENPRGVRAAILDSVLTPDAKTFEVSAQSESEAFAGLIDLCRNDLM